MQNESQNFQIWAFNKNVRIYHLHYFYSVLSFSLFAFLYDSVLFFFFQNYYKTFYINKKTKTYGDLSTEVFFYTKIHISP